MFGKIDIDMTEDGDLSLDETGDFDLAVGKECLKDDLTIRIKTQNPDWYHYPFIGADLDTLIGEKNTRETGEKAVDLIINALTAYNFLSLGDIEVIPIPISSSEIIFYIVINEGDRVALRYSYETGIEEVSYDY